MVHFLLGSCVHADYKPEGSSQVQLATKYLSLFHLPHILVLHIKRFQFTSGIIKNHK